jgi:hypothetical protein
MNFAGSVAMQWIEVLELFACVMAAIVTADIVLRLWSDPD